MKKFLSLLLVLLFFACAPGPRRQLTSAERVADMHWMFSKFDQNYAPREMKAKLHHFDYAKLKDNYEKKAAADQTNEEFYSLLMQFIAEFKDAHTSGNISASSLPGRTQIAYLGFSGQREDSAYRVKKLLPTFQSGTNFPIKVGDKIIAIDGVDLKKAVDTHLTKYRNLGLAEANYTHLMGSLFTKNSMQMPLPTATEATLTLERADANGKYNVDVTIPWITKDLVVFNKEQKEAVRDEKKAQVGASYNLDLTDEDFNQINSIAGLVGMRMISLEKLKAILANNKDITKISTEVLSSLRVMTDVDNFALPYDFSPWTVIDLMETYFDADSSKQDSPMNKLRKERLVPQNIYEVPGASTYPAYLGFTKDKSGAKQKFGYIRLNTFSPEADEKLVIAEFKNTIKYFKDFEVKKLVIDLIDNGGGSLSLGSQLAQALSAKKLKMPAMQVKLNETWLDNFQTSAISNKSDAEATLAARIFDKLEADRNKDLVISRVMPMSALYPFALNGNRTLMLEDQKSTYDFELSILVNEMCASMCDIFASIIQDNDLGKVVGGQTMGAGGNVTSHAQAPNSGLVIRQTESLIVRARDKADYLENAGVVPDIKVDMPKDRANMFMMTIGTALKELLDPADAVVTKNEEKKAEEKKEEKKADDKKDSKPKKS